MNAHRAGHDSADTSLRRKREHRPDRLPGALDVSLLDAGQGKLGACAGFVTERAFLRTARCVHGDGFGRLLLGLARALVVEMNIRSGGVVVLLSRGKSEQTADGIQVVRLDPRTGVFGP